MGSLPHVILVGQLLRDSDEHGAINAAARRAGQVKSGLARHYVLATTRRGGFSPVGPGMSIENGVVLWAVQP